MTIPPFLQTSPPEGPEAAPKPLAERPGLRAESGQGAEGDPHQEGPKSTIQPLRAAGSVDEYNNQPHQYWPFTASHLYNWRSQSVPFSSQRPYQFIRNLFTHQPTWMTINSYCRCSPQRTEARKVVPGTTGIPTTDQAQIGP